MCDMVSFVRVVHKHTGTYTPEENAFASTRLDQLWIDSQTGRSLTSPSPIHDRMLAGPTTAAPEFKLCHVWRSLSYTTTPFSLSPFLFLSLSLSNILLTVCVWAWATVHVWRSEDNSCFSDVNKNPIQTRSNIKGKQNSP